VIEGLLGFAAMFALMALRVPIAVAMGLVGLVGFAMMRSWPAAISERWNVACSRSVPP
jgi:xanthosine utilization system XapX-like protein